MISHQATQRKYNEDMTRLDFGLNIYNGKCTLCSTEGCFYLMVGQNIRATV
jgi:hypothetical protein